MAVDTRPYVTFSIQRSGDAFSGYGRPARILYQRRFVGRSPGWRLSGLTAIRLLLARHRNDQGLNASPKIKQVGLTGHSVIATAPSATLRHYRSLSSWQGGNSNELRLSK